MEESAIDRLLWTTSEISFGANRTRGLDWHSRHTNSGARVRNTPRTHLPIARIDAGNSRRQLAASMRATDSSTGGAPVQAE
jgi:hypothetical protein